jgi:broad specificity phosphatase PhoE
VTETKVHLVRHGEVFNPRHVLYGRLPGYPLSDLGERMAALAAKALAGRDVETVYTSPLERAVQTAEPIAAVLGAGLTVDERLIESASHFEGRVVEGWRSFADGEPYVLTARRMLAAVTEMRDGARGREVVGVSHQLPIYVLRRFVEGRPLYHRPDRRQCGLASITTFTWRDARLVSVTYTEPAGELSRRPSTPGA